MSDEAQRIQDALRAMAIQGRELVHVDPFVVTIDPSTPMEFMNYAVPERGALVWPDAAIEDLCTTFTERERMPRLEFVDDCWPGLRAALEAHSFSVDLDPLGMVCTAGDLVELAGPAGLVVEPVRRDAPRAMIVDLLEVRRRAFADLAGGERTSEADIVRFRERGPGSVLARTTEGEAVGAASWQAIQLGVTEIVAVGVLPEYRRQGIAGAVTSAAAGDAFAHGAEIAFLTPGGDEAARVYERAGFRPVVRCLHMSRR